MKRIIALVVLLCACVGVRAQRVEIYPVPKGIYYAQHNDDYTVRVRCADGDWIDLYEYKVRVDMDAVTESSMVQFDAEGEVEIEIKKNNGTFRDVVVRPDERGIVPKIGKDGLVRFKVNGPQKLSVEFDGDHIRNLQIFVNPIQNEIPKADTPNVIYFGEGMHSPEGAVKGKEHEAEWLIPSNTTVYLAQGAVLRGKLVCRNVENVRIIGRGIMFQPQRGVEIAFSKNVTVDGITFINPAHYTIFGGQSQNITIRNIKSFSCRGWSDGIDLMSCSDVLIEDVYMRNSDDCIAIYGHRWDYYGDVRNIEVRNSILWADIAHPINIGIHGYTKEGDAGGNVIENLRFRNIDILEHDEDDLACQGCMCICVGDCNLVRGVLFEDIRIARIEEGQLFRFEVAYSAKYNSSAGRGIEKVTVRNVTATAHGIRRPLIKGHDATHAVKDIRFENFVLNGKKIRRIEDLNIEFGDHVSGVVLIK